MANKKSCIDGIDREALNEGEKREKEGTELLSPSNYALSPSPTVLLIKKCLHKNQMADQVGAYIGFCSIKQEYLYFPLDGMLVHHRVTPSITTEQRLLM